MHFIDIQCTNIILSYLYVQSQTKWPTPTPFTSSPSKDDNEDSTTTTTTTTIATGSTGSPSNYGPTESPTLSPSTLEPTSIPTLDPTLSPTKQCYPIANKLKVQSITGEPIQMFELEVYSNDVNVALGKPASQSSNLKRIFGASNAVDGKGNTFSHTAAMDECSWFEVDLKESMPIDRVYIANRWCVDTSDPNGCLCRLSRVAVSLFDGDKWVDTTLIGDTCGELEWTHYYVYYECTF